MLVSTYEVLENITLLLVVGDQDHHGHAAFWIRKVFEDVAALLALRNRDIDVPGLGSRGRCGREQSSTRFVLVHCHCCRRDHFHRSKQRRRRRLTTDPPHAEPERIIRSFYSHFVSLQELTKNNFSYGFRIRSLKALCIAVADGPQNVLWVPYVSRVSGKVIT